MFQKKAFQILDFLFYSLASFGEFVEKTGETLFHIKFYILDIILEF